MGIVTFYAVHQGRSVGRLVGNDDETGQIVNWKRNGKKHPSEGNRKSTNFLLYHLICIITAGTKGSFTFNQSHNPNFVYFLFLTI